MGALEPAQTLKMVVDVDAVADDAVDDGIARLLNEPGLVTR